MNVPTRLDSTDYPQTKPPAECKKPDLSARTRLPILYLASFFLIILSGNVAAATLDWSFPLGEGEIAKLEILSEDGSLIARLLTSDGSTRNQGGWRPDSDPRRGMVRGNLEHLLLAPGQYQLREVLPDGIRTRKLDLPQPQTKSIDVHLPSDTWGVIAWHHDNENGSDGLSFAPLLAGGMAKLPIGPGRWNASVLGAASVMHENVDSSTETLHFANRIKIEQRSRDTGRQWMVRFLLLPATLVLLGFGLYAVWRSRRIEGFKIALLVSIGLGFLAIWPVLENPEELVLAQMDTPLHSMTFFTAIMDSFPHLSDVSSRFSYPEGATWLLGHNWLGYLLVMPFAVLTNPVVAHNLGVGFSLMLLALSSWYMVRRLGAGPWASLLAPGCIILLPDILRIADCLRIDYLTLYLVPIFFLCLHKTAEKSGWRWPVAAGVSLAAVFYGQTYYGLYLASACPLLIIPRLVGSNYLKRLLRISVVGLVAGILLTPGLITLHISTRDTTYDVLQESLRETCDDLWSPLGQRETEQYILRYADVRVPPMGTPKERLLAAVTRSRTIEQVVAPSNLAPGHSFYWLFVLLSICLAQPKRRRFAIIAALDVGILLLYSLGPFARTSSHALSIPLPYYLNFLFIPSFENLKAVTHFGHLATALSSIPLVFGLDGLFHRLQHRKAIRLKLFRFLSVVLLCIFFVSVQPLKGRFLEIQWPEVMRFPTSTAIAGMDPAPTLALPFFNPPHPRISVDGMRHGLSLVNPLSFGQLRRLKYPYWVETNGILNQLAWKSGSDTQKSLLGLGDPSVDIDNLRQEHLRYIVLYRTLLPEPGLVQETESLLDGLFVKAADDGDVAVWDVNKAIPSPL